MSILDLSYELILLITDCLTEPCDVYALLQTHRGMAQFLAPVLSKFALQKKYSTAALLCYIVHGNATRAHAQLQLYRDTLSPPITQDNVTATIAAGANFTLIFKSIFHAAVPQRALHWAVINDKPAMISFLISKGADIEFRDPKTGGTVIDHAIAQGNSRLVDLLVAKGADVTVWEKNCGSLLHCVIECLRKVPMTFRAAAEPNFKDILITLLNNGANIDVRDRYGHTALHLAAMCWTGATEELLRAGADVNARDLNDNTPLHLTVLGMPTFEVLLKNGADPTLRDADRRAPICLHNTGLSIVAKKHLLGARFTHSCGKKRKSVLRKLSEYDSRVLTVRVLGPCNSPSWQHMYRICFGGDWVVYFRDFRNRYLHDQGIKWGTFMGSVVLRMYTNKFV